MARRPADPMDAITKDIHKDVRIFLDNRDIKWTDIIEWSTGPVSPSNEDEVVFQFPEGKNWRYAGIHVCVAKKFITRPIPVPEKRFNRNELIYLRNLVRVEAASDEGSRHLQPAESGARDGVLDVLDNIL